METACNDVLNGDPPNIDIIVTGLNGSCSELRIPQHARIIDVKKRLNLTGIAVGSLFLNQVELNEAETLHSSGVESGAVLTLVLSLPWVVGTWSRTLDGASLIIGSETIVLEEDGSASFKSYHLFDRGEPPLEESVEGRGTWILQDCDKFSFKCEATRSKSWEGSPPFESLPCSVDKTFARSDFERTFTRSSDCHK